MEDESKLLPTPREFAVETWNALSKKRRSLAALNKALAQLGRAPVAKSNLWRWLNPPTAVKEIGKQIAGKPIARPTPAETAEMLKGIPSDLIDVFGVRVLLVAKGQGLDRLEDAIVKVASAIAGKSEEIANAILKPGDESLGAKNAVSALSILAESMHRVVAARTLPSMAHRNYGEGDRFAGEGEKFKAEAENTRAAGRVDAARTINNDDPFHGRFDNQEEEDDTFRALRERKSRQ